MPIITTFSRTVTPEELEDAKARMATINASLVAEARAYGRHAVMGLVIGIVGIAALVALIVFGPPIHEIPQSSNDLPSPLYVLGLLGAIAVTIGGLGTFWHYRFRVRLQAAKITMPWRL